MRDVTDGNANNAHNTITSELRNHHNHNRSITPTGGNHSEDDDDDDVAQQYRYALHGTEAEENPQTTSHLSNDTPPVPPGNSRMTTTTRILRKQQQQKGQYCYPLPGMRLLTFAAMKERSIRWFYESAWPGMGLFGESYLLFSTGILKPIWQTLFPDCFAYETCSPALIHSLTYSVVVGVIIGMMVFGYLAKYIGRRKGSIWTASIMAGGALGLFGLTLLSSNESSPVVLIRAMVFWFFVFGIGVGGEYPLAASSATEKSMSLHHQNRPSTSPSPQQRQRQQQQQQQQQKEDLSTISEGRVGLVVDTENSSDDHDHADAYAESDHDDCNAPTSRGRQVLMVFTMQGVGIWCNSISMTILLACLGQTGYAVAVVGNYTAEAIWTIWRTTYLIGAVILVAVLWSRKRYLKESTVWADDKYRREDGDDDDDDNDHDDDDDDKSGNGQRKRHQHQEDDLHPKRAQTPNTESSSVVVANGNVELSRMEKYHQRPSEQLLPITLSNVSSLSNPTVAVDPFDETSPDHGLATCSSDSLEQQDVNNNAGDDAFSGSLRDRGSPFALLRRHYGMRLFGASASWLLWDIAFYGNKLFQSSFLFALTGNDTTLFQFGLAATLNATVALAGYLAAAYWIDHIGRITLQGGGFLLTGLLFILCGFALDEIPTSLVIVLYLASSFFGQGPNATTFLVPAEIFPTEMRTLGHGIAAASGKVGALIAAISFNYIENDLHFFLFCGYASFLAAIVTMWAIPESSGLDVAELDQQWRMTLIGKRRYYQGAANYPKHRSMYENWKANRKQKVFDSNDDYLF